MKLPILNLLAALTLVGAGSGCQQAAAPETTPTTPRVVVTTQPSQLTWSGEVDDSATIFAQGSKTWTDNVSGKGTANTNATFVGTLPANAVTVKLASHSGRGQVQVIQQPTRDNNFTAGVRIIDSQAGSEHYDFVLTW
ncbi:MAG TPA: hypothetical protein VGK19_02170 [Capsulimonadaceae bacterium]|jgi:hypothetical protein